MIVVRWYVTQENVVNYRPSFHKARGKFLYFIDKDKETLLLGENIRQSHDEIWSKYLVFRIWMQKIKAPNGTTTTLFNGDGAKNAQRMLSQLVGSGSVGDNSIDWENLGFNAKVPEEKRLRVERLIKEDHI